MTDRYAFSDLEFWVRRRFGEVDEQGHLGLSDLLDTAAYQLYFRGHTEGSFTEHAAEMIAIAFGGVPEIIWPGWENHADGELCHWCDSPMNTTHGTSMLTRCCQRLDARRDARADRRINRISERVAAMNDVELAAFLGLEWPFTLGHAKSWHGLRPLDRREPSVPRRWYPDDEEFGSHERLLPAVAS